MFDDDKQKQIDDIEAELRVLSSLLSSNSSEYGDYKIIKIYEATLQNLESPYDLDELVTNRQKIRDKINELQGKLMALRNNN